ncbi:MAG: aminotransferase class I/II-fold pyridoxal phosphate-dependent enzyme [Candidatus Magasanikbacteria bacterium]|nr:aminotransferase class I/II-fold pyridoxal phosphate-dependent enzyme [Candidatus Magasanikbacteria bacterium]
MPLPSLIARKRFVPGQDWLWYAPNGGDAFGEHEGRAVEQALRQRWLTTGKITAAFETKVARLFGKRYGLFVNSGSSANLLALAASNLPRGAEVITPACTFNTTASPIVQLGFTPVFVDVTPSYVIDVAAVERAITKTTAALMVPHLIGNFADLPRLRALCRRRRLLLIEDSCDTIGGTINGAPSGRWSDIVTTSFYASHVITAGGAGGMLMTNDQALCERARVLRDWGRGISRHDQKIRSRLATFKLDGRPYDSAFVFVGLGYNFRPTEMQAAFGLAQLDRLSGFLALRRRAFKRIYNFLAQYPEWFYLPETLPSTRVNWLAFPVTIKSEAPFDRNTLVRYLEDHRIQTRPLFSGNILKHPAYRGVRYRSVGSLRHSQTILNRSFLIGCHHGLTDAMIDYLCTTIAAFVGRYR